MDWLARLQKLPLISVQLREPTDDECIEEVVDGAKIIVTHQYYPVHKACYTASLSGPVPARERLIEAISNDVGKPIILEKDKPSPWICMWTSGCADLPMTSLREIVTDDGIAEICTDIGLDEKLRPLVNEMIALSDYFMFNHAAEKSYLEFLLEEVEPEKGNKVIAALHYINLRYVELQKN